LGKRPRINVDYAEAVWCEWASFTLADTSLDKVEPSPPYIQAIDVGVERSGGVGKDKSRSMRASSKLPGALGKKITQQQLFTQSYTPRWIENSVTAFTHVCRSLKQSGCGTPSN
jgi:hypothetical protein